ncbi:hypothetical protein J2Z32_004331 [Paenibacillus turicensis]|uniref:DUF445 domain-containing protein n=1 Tax=Paenibacillus turicensis TaxID=160487 RepID=A0ABS4FYK1_9BACL|nr:hypothetical protein [Paenibacillus turicensis]MBP1907651.1 hypothetical protein [Paenibacillus turicensis]
MKTSAIIDYSFLSIARRIKNASSQQIAELAEKNVLDSTYTITETFNILTREIKLELIDLIQDISKVKINIRYIPHLRVKVNDFIQNQYNDHKQYLTKMNIYNKYSTTSINDFIHDEIEDAKSSVELQVIILEKKLNDQRKQIFWDISKMVLSAIIGGLIGAYLKSLFGA